MFDPANARAWWLRYILFAPADPRAGAARATPRAVAGKDIRSIAEYASEPGRFGVRFGTASLASGAATGEARTDRHTLAWELLLAITS